MAKTYEPISTQTLTNATTNTVTFSSIPQTYTDLVLVVMTKSSSTVTYGRIRFNSDTASNYSRTYVLGNGTSAISAREANTTSFDLFDLASSGNTFGVNISHIMNYSNTTTNKNILNRDSVSSIAVNLQMGWYRSTAAITTISVFTNANFFANGSTFTLYGIKAA